MSKTSWVKFLLPVLLLAAPAFAAGSATVKVGTAVEKYEVTGESAEFSVAPNTRIYAGAKVSGVEGTKVTFVWTRDGKEVSKKELDVPRSPYRTHAYRTFRAGDTGSWTVRVVGADGTELGSSTFQVTVSG
jgi:membrane-associated protease RseP (regulator of RpoE activity)